MIKIYNKIYNIKIDYNNYKNYLKNITNLQIDNNSDIDNEL